jgi:hypothetical protein
METPDNRVPLVIGVTGHRDLREQDIPLLEREFGDIISRLRRDYIRDESDAPPLVLISALAEGADRVAARVALAMGVKLIAPLPLPAEEYRKDFQPGLTPDAATEFDRLLSHAIAAPVMEYIPGISLEGVRSDADQRAEQYRAVGLFIVQHCDVLVAMWDGKEIDRATGGSAEVVGFKREGIPLAVSRSAHVSLDGSEIGPVIHVLTPRNKPDSPANVVSVRPWGREVIDRHRGKFIRRFMLHVGRFCAHLIGREPTTLLPLLSVDELRDLEAWETFESLSSLTRDFNRESSELELSKDPIQQSSSIDRLFTDSEQDYFDGGSKLRAMRLASHWCWFFGVADTLAKKRQAQFRNDWFALFVLSFVAFFLFAMSGHIDSRPGALLLTKCLLAGYMIVIGVVFALFIRARLRRDQERYLHYRAFAEALRVAIYWSLLGIVGPAGNKKRAFDDDLTTGTIRTVTGYYPIKRPSELAWIKICLRTLDLCHQAAPPTDHGLVEAEAHTVARRFWVRGQLSYFEQQGTLHNRHAEALENWSIIILVTTPFFLVPLLLSAIGDSQFLGLSLHEVFLIATGILPGIAAFLTGYSERLALTAQARQYDRMRMLFKRACDLLPERLDTDTAQYVWSLYRELGIEAMKESADWVSIYQQRPIQPVQ